MQIIEDQVLLDIRIKKKTPSEAGKTATPPPEERPYGVFYDSLNIDQAMARSAELHAELGRRSIVFPGFEKAKDFFEIGTKFLTAKDGSRTEAADMAEDLFSQLGVPKKWSTEAWEEYRKNN